MTAAVKRLSALPCAAVLAASLASCGTTVSTGSFKGEEHEVAQTISNLQADVTASDAQKICANDLAGAVVARLNAAKGGCKQVIKNQLVEVDNYEVKVQSIQVHATGTQRTAGARVTSIIAGKTRASTLALVNEGGKWKVSGVQ
ncbi:MAG: hypothetical protein M3Z95_00755 [Actinomycetota bacterium]|nr:hypothetical protein [Actinomycetota bacterium]